jgi:NitT/TauT family transport system ATP-binding protein
VSLIGPSGCGKTTLLKLIDGLLDPDDGELLVLGDRVVGPGPERAMVFQQFALLPWLTVVDNIAFGLRLRRVPTSERRRVADELVEMVGLEGFEQSYPYQLSGGMQQRVGLARALAVDPSVLLMDEPFSAVDALTRMELQEDLLAIWERTRKAVVFVTHSIEEAILLSDRVMVMGRDPGRIVEAIDVDLPRPRSEQVRRDPVYAGLVVRLWDSLAAITGRRETTEDKP